MGVNTADELGKILKRKKAIILQPFAGRKHCCYLQLEGHKIEGGKRELIAQQ